MQRGVTGCFFDAPHLQPISALATRGTVGWAATDCQGGCCGAPTNENFRIELRAGVGLSRPPGKSSWMELPDFQWSSSFEIAGACQQTRTFCIGNPSSLFPPSATSQLPTPNIFTMASMFAQSGNGTLFLGGQKVSGADIRDQNGLLLIALSSRARPAQNRRHITDFAHSHGYTDDCECRQKLIRSQRLRQDDGRRYWCMSCSPPTTPPSSGLM